jgi:hypothetical protein
VPRSRGVAYGAGQSVYAKRDREQRLGELPAATRPQAELGSSVLSPWMGSPTALRPLGWEALHKGRLRNAIRIAAEPFLGRAGTEGRNAQTPAALAYKRLEMPDSAAAIYDRLARRW